MSWGYERSSKYRTPALTILVGPDLLAGVGKTKARKVVVRGVGTV